MKMSDYVETDIGEFPKDWEVKKLKDIITYKKGVKPKQLYIKRIDDNYVPYLTAEYLRGQSEPRYVDMNEKRLLVAEPEDILMIWDGSAAGDLFTGFRGAVASTFVRIKCNRNIINCKYLYYYLLERVDILKKRTKGTGIPHINKDTFENLQIPLPPLEEQKKIVELLQKVDELIIRFNDFLQNLEDEANTLYKSILRLALTGKLTEDWRRQIILLRSVVIPYLVYQASKVKGRPVYMTELMKYLFLLQKEYNINLAYNFEPYKYGPFTPQLYKDLEELKDRIEVKEVKDNVDKSLITSKELPQVNQDIANAVNDLINRFGNKDLKELLSYVYKKYPEYTVKSE